MNTMTMDNLRAYTDNDIMPFGKYKGKRIVTVPAVYLLWLYECGITHSGVRGYIINHLSELQAEASRLSISIKPKRFR